MYDDSPESDAVRRLADAVVLRRDDVREDGAPVWWSGEDEASAEVTRFLGMT